MTFDPETGEFLGPEARAGVEAADFLLARRREAVDKMAVLHGIYGPGGPADHMRSSCRSGIAIGLRAKYESEGKKITETRIEDESKMHDEYLDFLKKMVEDRTELFRLEQEVHAIDMKMNRGQAILRAYASEPR